MFTLESSLSAGMVNTFTRSFKAMMMSNPSFSKMNMSGLGNFEGIILAMLIRLTGCAIHVPLTNR